MGDVTADFQRLQKRLQQSDLILPDVLETRNSAIRQLTLMRSGPSPGGLEEKFFVTEDHTPMRAHNSYITQQCSYDAAHIETVQADVNFLEQRLNEEQEETVDAMIRLTNASTLADFLVG